MGTALVIGGNGQIGVPAAAALARDGWQVRVMHRGSAPLAPELVQLGVGEHRGDRGDDDAVAAAVGDGVDVVLDCVAYHGGDAAQVLAHHDRLASAVVISSAAVYADAAGRTLGDDTVPDLPVGVREDQVTVPPGRGGYAVEKAELEQTWLAGDVPVTVLRPGAIHGPRAQNPREWFAVKRVLDGRRDVVLAFGGGSRFHTSAVANIAELVRLAARQPGRRVLNAVDPQAPSSAEIVRAVYETLGHDVRVHGLDGPPEGTVGMNPWGVPAPWVLDMTAASSQLGYVAPVDYVASLPPYLDWVVAQSRRGDWRETFTVFARHGGPDLFDYAAEDAWLAAHRDG